MDDSEGFSNYLDHLMELCNSDPDQAIFELDALFKTSPQLSEKFYTHALYFFAFSGKGIREHDNDNPEIAPEILAYFIKAFKELSIALKSAEYQEEETYYEEVVVKPAGLFTKAKTEMHSKIRTVTKNYMDELKYLNFRRA